MNDDSNDGGDGATGGADEKRRALIKGILGGAAAYSMPLVVSFSMGGLRIGSAQAHGTFVPPGLSAGNELPPAFQGKAKGRPFNEDGFPPARPVGGNMHGKMF